MRQLLICFIFTLLTILSHGQKKSVGTIKIEKAKIDTIDYTKMPFTIFNEYTLRKITQFNGQAIYDMNGRQLFFVTITDTTNIRKYNPTCFSVPNLGDTSITINWDSNTKEVHDIPNHLVGNVHLKQSNNILVITTSRIDPKTKKCFEYTKLFKILKLSFSEIILKDVSNPQFKRTFYFRRQPPN
jgi:hypothetical protein